jgi:hypothetical protein
MAKSAPEPVPQQEDLIRAYKLLLQAVLDQRPSGSRQRLADALGKHRSFVTQMTSPAYPTPIPQRHLPTVFAVCHFTPEEREAFLAAYRRAHRGRLELADISHKTRHLNLLVPDLGDESANAEFDRTIGDFVTRMAELIAKGGQK